MTMPVLFLPGSLCDERVFADQLLRIDHPSAVADLTLDDSLTAMATRALSEAPPQFAVVGLSMGGIIAAEIARLARERVSGMALIDFNLDAPDEAQNQDRRRWAADVRAGHFARVVEEIGPKMSISPEVHGPLIADMARRLDRPASSGRTTLCSTATIGARSWRTSRGRSSSPAGATIRSARRSSMPTSRRALPTRAS